MRRPAISTGGFEEKLSWWGNFSGGVLCLNEGKLLAGMRGVVGCVTRPSSPP